MSRNGSGTYTVPNTFNPGEVISSADHNQNFDDLGDEITNSLALDGQSTMSGALKLANGTVGAPGLTFGADTDSGLARTAVNELSLVAGGVAQIVLNDVTVAIAGTLTVGGFTAGAIVGEIRPYALTTAPSGWHLCDGSALTSASPLRTALIAASNPYGVSGSDPLLPDLRGRQLVGKDNMGGSAANRVTNAGSGIVGTTLGATGGAQNVTIAQGNLPNATLTTTITDPQHTHTLNVRQAVLGLQGAGPAQIVGWVNNPADGSANAIQNASTGITASTSLGGSGTALAKMDPTLIVNFIIFVGA